jgi:hypothetical protein
MKKQELLNKLQSSEELVKIAYVPVAEVINWVNELETDTLDANEIDDIADDIIDNLDSSGTDVIGDYDLEMNYREVELSSISFNTRQVKEIVKEALEKYLKK